MYVSRSIVVAALVMASLAFAAPATAKLPRTYQVQNVDSPNPSVGGDFGIGFVNTGDVNGDGKDDILVGTDEHGGGPGQVFVISGADGSTIRTISSPDPGGAGTPASFGSFVGKISDIGSCPTGASGQTCPNATIGAADGVPDQLISANAADVGGLVDAGRAYVIDGATGAVLKRLDMPASDITDQQTAPGGPAKPAFGRTILNPAGQAPCAGNMGVGSCGTAPPAAVIKGDMNGGGQPDILVGASDYFETGATANPASPCAASPTNNCLQAGREYVFLGENIAGTDPAVIKTADVTIKNPTAQPDDATTPVNNNRESMGYSIAPVGDLGRCTTNPGPGAACTNANSTGTADGKPDFILSSHRTDDFGMFDAGVAYVVDGSTNSILYTYHHPEPQPASLFAFSNYNQPAVGDVGSSSAPDVYQAAMRQNNPFTGGGKGYVMNGAFKQGGSPNAISFGTFVDPTPHPSEDFGTSSAGVGNVAGAESGLDPANEILIGAYGPHNPGTNPFVINDVHFFSAKTETSLQSVPAPDQQQGSGFGTALAPLGDLNGDGMLDFAVGAGLYDGTTGADQGRIYIFRSDDSPAPVVEPPAQPSGPAGPQGQQGTAGASGPAAAPQAGRTIDLAANRSAVTAGRKVKLSGIIEAFANPAGCEGGQSVQLQRRRPGSLPYRTFKSLTSNSAGRFANSFTPSTTYLYRAVVRQSDACLGATSDREQVTVRKRRAKR